MRSSLTRAFRVLAGTLDLPSGFRRSSQRASRPARSVTTAFFEPLENRTLLSTYYVSLQGSDNNSGTSPTSAWKSVAKVNGHGFNPGDSILFQAGQTFSGGLSFRATGNSSSNPVNVSSFGSGRATISSGTASGVYIFNTGGITIQNLVLVGKPGSTSQCGVRFESNVSNKLQSAIKINNCDISGYNWAGVMGIWDNSTAGFNGITITNNNIHNCETYGINTTSNTASQSSKNCYVAHNTVSNIYGDPTQYQTGNGITIGGLDGAVIEYNDSHDNGLVAGNSNCGIWAAEANNVVIQYNISYGNRSPRGTDGDGFDLDTDASNSVLQYNYAYNNDGNGFQLNQWRNDNKSINDVIRYNVSQDNGQAHNYAGIEIWGKILNSAVYNNTVYVSPATRGGQPSAVKIHNRTIETLFVSNLYFANNIFIATGGRPLMTVTSQAISGAKNLKFVGNDWWTNGGSVSFTYGSTYGSLSSFESNTGQETMNGQPMGMQLNPGLTAPGQGAALTNPQQLASLSAYRLLANSPLVNHGVNVGALFGTSTVKSDFFGDATPQGSAFDIGANETGVTGSTPPPSGGGSLPSGWNTQDVGNVGKSGNASYSNSTYSLSGAGSNILGTNDAFRYAYTSLNGDGQIIAKVSSLSNTNDWAKAGVMIRTGTWDNASEISMLVSPNGQASFESRNGAGSNTNQVMTGNAATPEWVKLIRSGNTLTGYISEDGNNWTKVSSVSIKLDANLEIGLVVSSHNTNALATATFSNVSVTS